MRRKVIALAALALSGLLVFIAFRPEAHRTAVQQAQAPSDRVVAAKGSQALGKVAATSSDDIASPAGQKSSLVKPSSPAEPSSAAAIDANTPSTASEIRYFPDPAQTGPYAEQADIARSGAARIHFTVSGRTFELDSLSDGTFPRLFVEPRAVADVVLIPPPSMNGNKFVVQAADGGGFPGSAAGGIQVDRSSDGAVRFRAMASDEAGTHRFEVFTSPSESLVFDLWVGPPSPVRIPSAHN